jgi:large subunit ribosomal protein L5
MRDVPALVQDFNYHNSMQVPRVAKVSVNVGVAWGHQQRQGARCHGARRQHHRGEADHQKAKKSIAQFKLREGQQVGVTVTLRRAHVEFRRLMNAALPRRVTFVACRRRRSTVAATSRSGCASS